MYSAVRIANDQCSVRQPFDAHRAAFRIGDLLDIAVTIDSNDPPVGQAGDRGSVGVQSDILRAETRKVHDVEIEPGRG